MSAQPTVIQPVTQAQAEAAWASIWGPLNADDRAECADVVRLSVAAAGRPVPRTVRERAQLSVSMHEQGLSWAAGRWWCLFGAPPQKRAGWRLALAWCMAWSDAPRQMSLFGGGP